MSIDSGETMVDKKFIERLLYSEEIDESERIAEIKKINDSKLLFMFVSDYNWDDGFKIPFEIINNPNCDMSTALLLFELSCGYEFFEIGLGYRTINQEEYLNVFFDSELIKFVLETYSRIVKNDFKTAQTEYIPELAKSKVQIYKLKKIFTEIPEIFINGIKKP